MTSFFKVIYSIECFTVILATPAIIIFCRTMDKSAVFHRNLVLITKFHYCAIYIALPSRMAILIYPLGFLRFLENDNFTPLFLALCFVNVFCKCVPTFAPPSMLLERLFASYYISDYETKSRAWVAASAIFTSCALSSFFAAVAVFGILDIDKVVGYAVMLCVIASITYVTLHRHEQRRLKGFAVGPQTSYYLSTRFQIIENLRVLKMIMYGCLIYSMWVAVPCTILFLVYYYFLPSTFIGQLLYETTELIFAVSVVALYMCSLLVLRWRSKQLYTLNRLGNRVDVEDDQYITDRYFTQLRSAWS